MRTWAVPPRAGLQPATGHDLSGHAWTTFLVTVNKAKASVANAVAVRSISAAERSDWLVGSVD